MPDNYIDLVVTSPPYDNLRDYKGYTFDFESIAKELYRIVKVGGVVVWVVNDSTVNGSESLTSFKQAIYFVEKCGFKLHDTMIYAKNNYVPLNHSRYEQAFEYVFVLSKGGPVTFNAIKLPCVTAGTYRNRGVSKAGEHNYAMKKRPILTSTKDTKTAPNIFHYNVGDGDKTSHNAPFPEKLAHDHIISWSNKGEIVYDPFGGSGTTAKMAEIAERQWILSEISAEYCEIARKRIEMVTCNLFNQT